MHRSASASAASVSRCDSAVGVEVPEPSPEPRPRRGTTGGRLLFAACREQAPHPASKTYHMHACQSGIEAVLQRRRQASSAYACLGVNMRVAHRNEQAVSSAGMPAGGYLLGEVQRSGRLRS